MNSIRFAATACMGWLALLSAAPHALGMDFFYVGPSNGNFFDAANWNDQADGLGAFLSTPVIDGVTGEIEHALVIDNAAVLAGASVVFGGGSLTMNTGAGLTVSGGFDIQGAASLTMTGAALSANSGATGQIEFSSGSTVSISGSMVTASDDIFLRGFTTIADSMFESTGDDIEFRDTATIVSISGSDFFASGMGTTDFNQFIILQTPSMTVSSSSFRGGLLGIDGETVTAVRAIDSSFVFSGDVENAFASSSVGVHTLSLEGTSTLEADQLEEGVALFLKGSSTATFIDSLADADGDSWLTGGASVRLDSFDASLVFPSDQITDVRNRVFNGLASTSYALSPGTFSPNNWDGFSAVTLQIVPEPMTGVLALVAGAGIICGRLR
ncbi:hypothetical protein [Botrimarina hoheduenensis]|uniref:PEP-CTERM protein-sorting domain-containing protein n=1 Tax=Botrimarina hoheduenensis TaxID=2528000 RepID=A0A5C5WAZ3_9BACT|nr:hypothetical protein [Botrimarina hoheduenensis]TWT47764.1 hypothetical protein Pla111_13850 [Botrimarina hoheduenensis]